jgi:hypothetical protein
MAIASAVMEEVKTRQLHVLFAMEDKILTRGSGVRPPSLLPPRCMCA